MEEHAFDNLDVLEHELRAHAASIGYVVIHQRGVSVGRRSSPDVCRGRLDWTATFVTDLGLHGREEGEPDFVAITIDWVRRKCAQETLAGSNRFRVRAYLPGGVKTEVDETVQCIFEGEEVPTLDGASVDDMVRTEAGLAVREALQLVQESLYAVQMSHRVATAQFREVSDERARMSRDLLAQNNRLTDTVADMRKAEITSRERVLTARERAIADRESASADLEQQADAIGRAERVLTTALGIRDLPDEVREMIPTLGTPDMREFLADPDVAAMLKNPEARAAVLPLLRGFAKSPPTDTPEAPTDGGSGSNPT